MNYLKALTGLTLIFLTLTACEDSKEKMLMGGTWSIYKNKQIGSFTASDQWIFKKDGTYELKVITTTDSIAYQQKGDFSLSDKQLFLTIEDSTYQYEVLKLNKDTFSIISQTSDRAIPVTMIKN